MGIVRRRRRVFLMRLVYALKAETDAIFCLSTDGRFVYFRSGV